MMRKIHSPQMYKQRKKKKKNNLDKPINRSKNFNLLKYIFFFVVDILQSNKPLNVLLGNSTSSSLWSVGSFTKMANDFGYLLVHNCPPLCNMTALSEGIL